MRVNKKLAAFVAASTVVTGVALSAGMGAANAATNLGPLVLTPGTGTAQSTINVATQSGGLCPGTGPNSPSSGVIADVTGPGITADGNNVIQGFTAMNLAVSGDHLVVPIGSKFFDIFQAYGVTAPSGTYTLRVACIGADSFGETGEFSVPVVFTAGGGTFNGTYVAQNPTSAVLSGPSSSTFGASVTYSVNVDPDEVAGSVQFKDGATNLGGPVAVNALGVASISTTALSVGSRSITAVFTPTDPASHSGTTSNAVLTTVASVSTTLTLTDNGTTPQFSPATFTATVSPAVSGTVTFTEGATTLGSATPNGSGVATFSTSNLSVGHHIVGAHFAPSGSGASASDSATVDHEVSAAAITPAFENLIVSVPAGSLTISLDTGADGNVDLGTATLNATGDLLTAGGPMDNVKVTDTRAGDPGWAASGIVTDFTKPANTTPAGAVNGYNLGWVPNLVTSAAHQTGLHVGATVNPASEPTATTIPSNGSLGLETARELGSATAGHGTGTATFEAGLSLNIPTDVPSGVYNATLTMTVI